MEQERRVLKPTGAQQLGAVLRKNWLLKKRAKTTTCCELMSPVLMMAILVLGYSLSEIEYYPAENYAVRELDLSDTGLLSVLDTTATGNLSVVDLDGAQELMDSLFAGPVPVPTFDQFVGLSQTLSAQITDETYDELVGSNEYGRQWGNLLTGGSLRFAPDTPLVRRLVDHLNETTLLFDTLDVYVHESEDAGVDALLDNLDERTWALVVVEADADTNFASTTIRCNYTTTPNTNWIVRWVSRGLDLKHTRYYLSGFLTLQTTVDEFLFEDMGLARAPMPKVGLPFPTTKYEQNIFFQAVGTLFGLMLNMATMHPMSKLVKALVEEKETRTKELMRIMGLRSWVFSMSWFITALITFTIIATSVTLILTSSFITFSDPVLVFALVGLFCLSEISFSFLISTLFSKAKLAAVAGPICLFAALLPRWIFFSTNQYEEESAKYVASLLSPTAFAFGADVLADYEYGSVGVSADNMNEGDFSFASSLTMLWVDFWLYGILAWYFDKAIPSEHGVHLPFYFPLTKAYWFPAPPPTDATAGSSDETGRASVEPVHPDLQSHRALQIQGLTKIYGLENSLTRWIRRKLGLPQKTPPRPAVNNLKLSMYSGQITCLLGHNGAGKTTTLAMLTGLIPPTSGDCRMFGMSINTEMPAIRQTLGLCPQHNVLFERLTVYEHVAMYAAFKGVPRSGIRAECEKKIADVGLTEKRNTFAGSLSGGMKRKLHVAIALIGDPQVVFLDEPTSGMDPFSRRATWNLLRRSKEGRVLVLTTHFMDEADLLGDRIAVVQHGQLQCCGSSLFLKQRFGMGYNLFLTKADASCSADAVREVVARHVPEMRALSSAAGEMAYQLPFGAVGQFAGLFAELEEARERLGVGGYGVSMTSMEEVFLRLAHRGVHADEGSGAEGADGAEDAEDAEDTDMDDDELDEESALLGCGVNLGGLSRRSVDIEMSAVDSSSLQSPLSEAAVAAAGANYVARNGTGGEGSVCSSVEPEITSEFGDLVDNGTSNKLVQFRLMIQKRVVCTLRDKKGFFFQVVLPVLLVALTLLILTIDINLSGPQLRLDAELYEPMSEVVYAGSEPLELKYLSPDVVTLVARPEANNSYELGEWLLDEYDLHEHEDRFGGFVHNDTIFYNITYNLAYLASLDYASVADVLDFEGVDLADLLDEAGGFDLDIDLDDLLDAADVDLVNATSDALADLNVTITDDTTVEDVLDQVDLADLLDGLNATSTYDDLLEALNGTELESTLEDLFNVSSLADVELDDLVDALGVNASTAVGDLTLDDIGSEDLTLESGTIEIVDGELVLVDVVIVVGDPDSGLVISVDNVTLDTDSGTVLFEGGAVELDGEVLLDLGDFELELGELDFPNETVTTLVGVYLAGGITVMHNSSSPHAVAAMAADQTSAQFRALTGDPDALYRVYNHPLPLTSRQSLELQTILSFFAAIFLLIPFCWIPAATAVFIVKERANLAKHQQLVSGLNASIYWLSAYVWDMACYLFLVLWCLVVFVGYDLPAFVGTGEQAAASLLLLAAYGMASIPLSYCYSFAFETPAGAQIGVMVAGFVTGFVFVIGVYIMESIDKTVFIAEALEPIFRIFPQYLLGDAMISLSTDYYLQLYLGEGKGPFSWDVCGRALVLLFLEALFYFAWCLVLEHGLSKYVAQWLALRANRLAPLPDLTGEDEDVRTERQRIDRGSDAELDLVRLRDVRKVYPAKGGGGGSKVAVKQLSVGVPRGECFGFLGINGAGKSSTMAMLTGVFAPTSGTATVSGYDVVAEQDKVREHIGFCPQFDALLELMTGRETLTMYARLKRIHPSRVNSVVNAMLRDVGLARYANRVCGAYSGGNKRKLSLGIALIGNPSVVFIDEASTGMDPVARRVTWSLIERHTRGRAIVLTTHSMEEAEALCGRIGIMVDGALKCLGSAQHLKSRHASGYILEVKSASETGEAVRQFVERTFENATLEEFHGSHFKFRMPPQRMHLGEIFATMEAAKEELRVEYYGVGQTSLENLFIQMVKSSSPSPGDAPHAAPSGSVAVTNSSTDVHL